MRPRESWDKYNTSQEKPGSRVNLVKPLPDGKEKVETRKSYTHCFFEDYNLDIFLNISCNTMLQLGASNGKFLFDYLNLGWNVTGYDYSEPAISGLRKKGIKAKQVDLNAREDKTLSYATELSKDISSPVNILLIRVLEYLEPTALTLLLASLIDQAAPGSVFFIAGDVVIPDPKKISKKTDLEPPLHSIPYYKASFFGARTDMDILVMKIAYIDDELLVIRKRS